MPTNMSTEALQQAIEGLMYQSETDAPWEVFVWPTVASAPTADAIRKWGRHQAHATVEEQSVESFFAPLAERQDWYCEEEKADAAKYGVLFNVVKQHLLNPKVFKVGEQKVAVYVVGQAKDGGWVGLKTLAVETG